jgi:hypothetical protein
MTRTRRRTWILLLAAGLAVVAVAWWAARARDDPRPMLREVLGMRDLPASVDAIECNAWGFTDVQTTCAFTVAASDFPRLLRGWSFREVPCPGRDSWHVTTGAPHPVGRRFPLAACYRAQPAEFEHGGSITVAADAGRTRVVADLYIE